MRFALTNGLVLTDAGFVEGRAVLVENGRISALPAADAVPGDVVRHDLEGAMLVPGFIDTQVNGGGGVLFNDAPDVETIRAIGAAHAAYGTTGFLPTLISDDLRVIEAGIAAVDAAIRAGVPGVLGIHVEGPFINADRRGIHDAARIRPLDDAGLAALAGLRTGRTVVTIAPEMTTPDTVRRMVASGLIVSAGHSNGSYAEISAAIDAGLTGFTHLFNAMSQLGNREPGAVGAALASEAVWCGLIVDGIHVSPVTMRLALRCKPANRFMLVTDAMPTTGSARSDFLLQGRRIFALDGRLVDAEGTLAGSDLTMIDAVRNAVSLLGVGMETAFTMASAAPAAFLGLGASHGRIAPGHAASLLCIGEDFEIRRSWIDGRQVIGLP
ncbi:MAG: N-acetylglucosamine-6-phosphate deacetylase [Sphingomonas sp. SCN 67-18]|uniref:N-acetylglucosamine-6-phosphate deacetylase n=1 Tax=uncultured Sphingomonas sp. TaxID=158754 RepID=UPI00086EBBFD|nr:N-acetylglucosamine-6-phosphate deacetylase [Sphingomonas sp. SCN 67-18]ODU22524.1 MAG: N-acetylglucosamine-6-phosphate deacetylase [Sphingomonas sp. SCN 67-18]